MAVSTAAKVAAPAIAERARGRQPSRTRSLFAATLVGFAAAALTYRMLRSPPKQDGENDGDQDSENGGE